MKLSQQTREFITLYLVVATELIGFGLIIPILPQIAYNYNQTPLMMGILLAAYSFAQFIAAPFLGALSDRIGRKPVLVISKLGSIIGYVVLALSHSYWMIFVSRLLDGFTGGNISAARAYAADITTEADRPKGMAVIGIAFGTGFILGPALGGLLYGMGNHGHMIAALTAGTMSLIALLLTIFILKEPVRRTESRHKARLWPVISSRAILAICIAQITYMILFSAFESTFSVYTFTMFQLTPRGNSMIFLFIGILALIIQGTITRKAPKNLLKVTIFGFLIVAVGFLSIHFSGTIAYLLGGLSILSLGVALVNSYLPSLLTTHCHADNRGAVIGVFEGIGSLSRVVGPIVGYTTILSPLDGGFIYFTLILVVLILGFSPVMLSLRKPTAA
jgi:DHA1 family tetracycline resistance protein-like MFS transporter